MTSYAFFNGKLMPLAEAKIGIMTHAFNYGTACFEGIRGNWNSDQEQIYLFRTQDHYQRLLNNCRLLKISIPYSIDELCQLTVELVEKNGYREDIYARPLAYKSSQVVGVRLHDLENDFLIFITPFGPYLDITNGIKCGVSSWRRIDDNMIPPRAKISGLYVNSALAKTEAVDNGFDEAIMLTHDGHVSEGSGENIFLIMDGKLVTPSPSDNILIGITRDTVIKLANWELGIETLERQIDRSELYIADECFLTGTAAHVTPVLEIDHRKVGNGEVGSITKRLQDLYFNIVQGRNKKYIDWCTPAYTKRVKA
ncbi:MAG: branched-chain amino acid transaminase [Chloroflexi bacterium]|jgi:branched-chain amino acid aminotransferase|nr:branched-chain amino acid transaminase [Chloroflexota bacterium]